MTLTRADLELVRSIFREELARAFRSGGPSSTGIGALVQGENQCSNENRRTESMDPTNTGIDIESSSVEETVRHDLEALRRLPRPRSTSKRRAGKPAAGSP